ncbi:hypothetical protein HELRODRAFT_160651 [Helobdella robusta]|uniref:Uncharacterized protein n=1 Tax=Helobdella robusta TaxID=6412 RepID=T1EQK0_HELRO|nr:hypothetical protein HELRODRAFT_160651 [Helobdella robusta]ESO06478.1 hypothetical protein HELRODRAFT_160651 [Helobdella robusta]
MASNVLLIVAFVLLLAVYMEYPPPAFSQELTSWSNKGKFMVLFGQRVFYVDVATFEKKFQKKEGMYSIKHQTRVVGSLLKELKITDVHILTHDLGVSIASELLSK